MKKFLVIQTAFIGDVVLSTAIAEKLHRHFPDAAIHYLVRKGNESLLANNPNIHEVLVWDKKKNKIRNLLQLLKKIRKEKYDKVINLQRFAATGFLTAFSGAGERIGFNKNPLSFLFDKKVPHIFDLKTGRHEIDRNNDLISHFTNEDRSLPALYPSAEDELYIHQYTTKPFVTMTPSSVWFTKKYPIEKWIDLIDQTAPTFNIYLLGGKDNIAECEYIKSNSTNQHVHILAGTCNFLQSTALMKHAAMNFVNDSGTLHFASAVNAPVTAIFCSTIPAFGYYPLSDNSMVIETREKLSCRPCGLHGHKSCPEKHFRCGFGIETNRILDRLKDVI